MLRIVQNQIPAYTYKVLSDPKLSFARLVVSTRLGGVSTGEALGTMNMGTRTEDRLSNVQQNYRLFCGAHKIPAERTVLANQTHSLNVRLVTENDAGKGIFKVRDYQDVDALITNTPNLPLSIHTADCVPVTLIDPENKAVGNAHCGWRGTLGSLSVITANEMKKAFGTNPEQLYAFIGPCIQSCCYEVSEDLYLQFFNVFGNLPELIFKKDEKFFLDLPGLNRHALQCIGVRHIHSADICTCCNKQEFYSHRGLGAGRGVFSTFVNIQS